MTIQSGDFRVRDIAIIGAGPSGIAAAKYLLAENYFSNIRIYEQRASVGGIWCRMNERESDSLQGCESGGDSDPASIPSPIYDGLESNIPLSIMQYSDMPFPKGTPLLPGWQTVLEYLKLHARDVEHLIKFKQKVLDVQPETTNGRSRWALTSLHLETKKETRETFDAVVVANGRYDDPFIPDIPGLDAWKKAYPMAIRHSKFYRNSRSYMNKKVIIVGYSSSGTDIGSQIESVCSPPLLVSQKSIGSVSPNTAPSERKELLPEIEEFLVDDQAVRFSNGRLDKHVDAVVFCTGYSYSYPFLSNLPEFSKGIGNLNTWHHIFYNPRPTLAFVLLPLRVNAFPFSESQSAIIARIWSNRLPFPSQDEREAWSTNRIAKLGTSKNFHKFGFPADVNYMNEMYDWCIRAQKRQGLINSGLGKLPPRWGDKEKWTRQRIHEIKKAVQDKGDARQVKSLEDIGFDFEAWRKFNEQVVWGEDTA